MKTFFRFSFALAVAPLLAACSVHMNDDGGSITPGLSAHGYPVVSATNVTDTNQCLNGPPSTSLRGRWQVDRRTGSFSSHLVFSFNSGSLLVTNNCEYLGHSMSSSVSSTYTDDGTFMRPNYSTSHTELSSDMDCQASIISVRSRYWFNGSCLVVQDDQRGETITMIPALYY